ncbi:uncharacterized protein LY89DRAFT_724232 [Mollisia scopiformis]|uniref:Uncharacterized protein n=1 Tax=Mollisia scopiformis TaxID=149040 RepID=A0A132BC58_MOLSC|nr:uncharacterized protein LY89DRAFT_724232 [Mollisia scopiformis]KUJ09853.1 hypothetical protein LY89DRAFT_724232 [Mollisia scopiformis]
MVFFFLSLRESGSRIEPDILPTSTSTSASLLPKAPPRWQDSEFQDYITNWDTSDKPALFRRVACMLALVLHLPINGISILSYGISFWLFMGIVISVLNLGGVGWALWKLDTMRGERVFYGKVFQRKHFDYVILGLVIVYGFFFGMFLFVRMRASDWAWFFRIGWPCTIAADIVCFISGWVATWRDVSLG